MRNDGDAGAQFRPAELIEAVAARQDKAAFAELFDFYAPRVKSMLIRSGAPADTAEDIAQEAMLTLWRKAGYYDASRASAAAWIYAIARNIRIDRLRRDNRAKLNAIYDLVEPEEPQRPDAALNEIERGDRVRSALGRLPGDQIRVVELSYFEGKAHGDIATILQIPLGTVKSRLRLATLKLREFLGDLT